MTTATIMFDEVLEKTEINILKEKIESLENHLRLKEDWCVELEKENKRKFDEIIILKDTNRKLVNKINKIMDMLLND